MHLTLLLFFFDLNRLYEVLENSEWIYLVMEYAESSLVDLFGPHSRLDENRARLFFVQTAYAIAYCHSHHIVHRDLKRLFQVFLFFSSRHAFYRSHRRSFIFFQQMLFFFHGIFLTHS